MKHFLFITLLFFNCCFADSTTNETSSLISFTPPEGWRMVDESKLSPSVLAMVVGSGSKEFPPSLNLGVHHNSGSLKEFLRFVKQVNQADGIIWTDLGIIRTQAGDASLSQLDTRTEWGMVREMQVIFVQDDNAYILTAAALREEFPKFYKQFFASLRSLAIKNS